MLSGLAKLLFTSTAIAPVGLTYAWVALMEGQWELASYIFWGCVFLFGVLLKLLEYAQKNLEQSDFSVTTIEAADRENIAFLLLYILPLFTAHMNTCNWHVWPPALIIFAIVISTGHDYHFNPLLGLMGWHFYQVCTEEGVTYVLITQKELRTAKKCLRVVQLTEYIVIDIEGSGK